MTKVDHRGELVFETDEAAHHAARLVSHVLELLPDGGNEILKSQPKLTLTPKLLKSMISELKSSEQTRDEDTELALSELFMSIKNSDRKPTAADTGIHTTEQPEVVVALENTPESQLIAPESDNHETGRSRRCTEDKELIDRMLGGDEAAGIDFVSRYDRLLRLIVNEVYNSIADSNIVSEEDLYQEAFEHLFRVAKKWEGNRGVPFHQYFMSYIRKRLRGKYAEVRNQVSISSNSWWKIKQADAENQRRRFIPGAPLLSDNELMDLLGTRNPVAIQEYYRALRLTTYIGSLDKGFAPGGQDTSLGDEYPEGLLGAQHVWSDPGEVDKDVSELYEPIELAELIEKILDTLSDRESGVIRMSYGLGDDEPKTLDEIATLYGVTRERIRQIHSKTMSKLRHNSRSRYLRSFLDDEGSSLSESQDKSLAPDNRDCTNLAS